MVKACDLHSFLWYAVQYMKLPSATVLLLSETDLPTCLDFEDDRDKDVIPAHAISSVEQKLKVPVWIKNL